LELGTADENTTEFGNSSVLQGIYFDKNFKISANDTETLSNLSPLELLLLKVKGKIDYAGLSLSDTIPPLLTKTFLTDERFPSTSKSKLENIALSQAIKPFEALTDAQKEALEDPKALEQSKLLSLIIAQLRIDQKISAESGERLLELAPDHPENYFFVQTLQNTNNIYGNYIIAEENINLATEELRKKHPQDVILLLYSLDKPVQFSNNPDIVYEKQISLTPGDGYVMSMVSPKEWLEMAQAQQFAGLSLLIILSNIENIANGMNEETVIKSLSTVGLINQAHHLAKEKLVDLMKASI
jgi:hypothetical protein